MADPKGNLAMYLLPGMKAEFTTPGFFVGTTPRKKLQADGEYKDEALLNGYTVEDEDIGTIEAGKEPNSIIYTHKKFAHNKITYYAKTGEIGEVDIIAVPVHDHSSIVTGGPAYGTYFTDDETVDGGGG